MGIGFSELMVILIIIMIIFGAGKLPEIGSAFGRSIRNFKQSMKEAESEDLKADPTSVATATPGQAPAGEPMAQAAPTAAKTEEEKMIDEAAKEIEKNRIGIIKTKHDGLVQDGDVFTESVKRNPFGKARDRGVSRDIL